jgi:hypothetical protein
MGCTSSIANPSVGFWWSLGVKGYSHSAGGVERSERGCLSASFLPEALVIAMKLQGWEVRAITIRSDPYI